MKTTTVTGTVVCDAQPVEKGTISFKPADGKGPTLGGEIAQAESTLSRAVAENIGGTKQVQITVIKNTGRKVPAGEMAPPGTMVDEIAICNLGVDGTLQCDLRGGVINEQNFDLKSP